MNRLMVSRPVSWILASLISLLLLLVLVNRSSQSTWRLGSPQPSSDFPLLQHVLNETLGFEKIFVINLPFRTDHRDSMALAAHFTGLRVEYIDGVTNVENKTLPPHDVELSAPVIGSWRAHMNIARMMIEHNITSALILEDDADWDLRLKSQMQNFARASRLLLQPQPGSYSDERLRYLDPTNPRRSPDDKAEDLPLNSHAASSTTEPSSSPYGDISRWDILWLGHCGTHFPRAAEEANIPLGRVIMEDESVPEPQHIEMQFGNDELMKQYPSHTRAVHRVAGNVCTLGYAMTLPAARRMLYELSVKRISDPMDLMIRELCEGTRGRKMRTCLTVQPQLFQHHRAIGPRSAESDIVPHPDEYNEVAFTKNIRWSTRVNFPNLIDGLTDWIDTFPDGAEPVDLGF